MIFSNEFENSQKIQENIYESSIVIDNFSLIQSNNNNSPLNRTIIEKNNGYGNNSILISKSLIENITSNSNPKENSEYLKGRNITNVTNEVFELSINSISSEDKLNQLSDFIFNINYNCKQFSIQDTIGPCIKIADFIESSFNYNDDFLDEIKKKFNFLKDFSFYRKIKGDGNCFYRAVIFKYFEMIILSGNVDLLKNIIYDILFECYNFNDKDDDNNPLSKYLKIGSEDKIKPKMVKMILILIYKYLEKKCIKEAYKIFYVSFNTCRSFDMGLIFYFRYILYTFIQSNEQKIYTKEFPVLIGNLLPENYEIDGNFDFNSFYENYLLKLYTDAEKIIIYLTPFVLSANLHVIIYDGNQNDNIQKISCPNLLNEDYNIYTLIKNSHYELIYLETQYEKEKFILNDYTNLDYQPNILKEEESKKSNNNSSIINNEKSEKSSSSQFQLLEDSSKINDKDGPLNNNELFENQFENESNKINKQYDYDNNQSEKSKKINRFQKENLSKISYNNCELSDNNVIQNSKEINNHNSKIKSNSLNEMNSYKNSKNNLDENILNNKKINNNSNRKVLNENKEESLNEIKTSVINSNSNSNPEYLKNNFDSKIENQNSKFENDSVKNKYIIEPKSDMSKYNNEESDIIRNNINKEIVEINDEKVDIDNKQNSYISLEINSIKSNHNSNKNASIKNEFSESDNNKNLFKSNNFKSSVSEINKFKVNENSNLSKDNCELSSNQKNIIIGNQSVENNQHIEKEIVQKKKVEINNKKSKFINDDEKNIFKNYLKTIKEKIKEKSEKERQNIIVNEYNNLLNKELFIKVKETICLNCEENIVRKKIKLPCGCYICNDECLADAFTGFNSLENKNSFYCICSHFYSIHELYELGLIFLKKEMDYNYENVAKLFNKSIYQQCSICERKNNIKQIIYYKSEDDNILGDYRKLTHFICDKCFKEKKGNFYCKYCEKEHSEVKIEN